MNIAAFMTVKDGQKVEFEIGEGKKDPCFLEDE